MARDICKVIEFLIVEVIPATENHVINGMRHIQRKAAYTPPESCHQRWSDLNVFLESELGSPFIATADEWKKRVGRIIRDEEKVPDSELPITKG